MHVVPNLEHPLRIDNSLLAIVRSWYVRGWQILLHFGLKPFTLLNNLFRAKLLRLSFTVAAALIDIVGLSVLVVCIIFLLCILSKATCPWIHWLLLKGRSLYGRLEDLDIFSLWNFVPIHWCLLFRRSVLFWYYSFPNVFLLSHHLLRTFIKLCV